MQIRIRDTRRTESGLQARPLISLHLLRFPFGSCPNHARVFGFRAGFHNTPHTLPKLWHEWRVVLFHGFNRITEDLRDLSKTRSLGFGFRLSRSASRAKRNSV